MALFGLTKPKYLNDHDRHNCWADKTGWVQPAQGNANPDATPETLVAIGTLSDRLSHPSIVEVYFDRTEYDGGDTITLTVLYDELVNVTNGATVAVGSTGATNPLTLTASAQTASQKAQFTVSAPSENGATLSVIAANISGTIVENEDPTKGASLSIQQYLIDVAIDSVITVGVSSSSSSSFSYSSSSSVKQNSSSSSSSTQALNSSSSSSSSTQALNSSSSSSSSNSSSSSSVLLLLSSSSSSSSSTAALLLSSSSSSESSSSSSQNPLP